MVRRLSAQHCRARRLEVTFSDDRAEFVRNDGSLSITMEVTVSPEDDAESTPASPSPIMARRHVRSTLRLFRTGLGTANRRCGAPRFRQTVCGNRVRPQSRRDPGRAVSARLAIRRYGQRISPWLKATAEAMGSSRQTARCRPQATILNSAAIRDGWRYPIQRRDPCSVILWSSA